MIGPRFLYLHGFASGPSSYKGVVLEAHYAARQVELRRLDLRLPSLSHLRLTAMMASIREAIGGERDRAVLFGSSLGGLAAARVAEEDPRVCALVLLAPAFGLVDRWHQKLGDAAWSEWQTTDRLEIDDHAEKKKAHVDFGFIEDLVAIDARTGGRPDVRVPTLIIHGVSDDVVGVESSRAWARERRWVKLVEVDDGHELIASLPRIKAEADAFLKPFL
ncbi:MAG: YqiA/YcfP family alpha/beta fold hydrolase [Polyangia bacterium]